MSSELLDNPEALVAAFEAGRIDNSEFPHRRHVLVAWMLAHRYPHEEAFRRLVAGIRGIAARAGHPEAFHETITRAWFMLIAQAETLDQHPELFDKSLLGRYYSVARLAEGRSRWIGPDLHPLVLPAASDPVAPQPQPAPGRPERSDRADVRGVLSQIPTAVAVIAVRAGQTVHATTISSLAAVSLEPALLSVCLANGSRTLDLLRDAGAFALSVLASDQDPLASRFADGERLAGRGQFAGVPHHMTAFGPILDDAAAWIGCSIAGMQAWGDHYIVVGRVGLAESTERHPLVRHDGRYH